MEATLFQGPHFHFNFLLNRVDVCGESHGKTSLHLEPAVIHWLECVCDLVSSCVPTVCASVLSSDSTNSLSLKPKQRDK